MSLLINLRHLKEKNLSLKGELSAEGMQIGEFDELVHFREPLRYELEVEKLASNLLITGTLSIVLDCECARCLKPFKLPIKMENWVCHVPLEGEEAAPIVNDCVDLTPYLREDTLLAFPQHPLCEPECGGLTPSSQSLNSESGGSSKSTTSAWAELNKLKFDE